MLRRRVITLDITTDEGRPEDWDWNTLLFSASSGRDNSVTVVNVERPGD